MKLGPIVALMLAFAVVLSGLPHLKAATRTAAKPRHRSSHSPTKVKAVTPKKGSAKSVSHVKPAAGRHRRSSASAKTGKLRKTSARRSRRPNTYARLAHMQMDPSRVENIQQALIGAGAMQGTPTGHWDAETHDAMARYQAQNGFGVTGLPDSKSLMKLGLGPHPLPPQLDKTAAPPPSNVDSTPQAPGDVAPYEPLPSRAVAPAAITDPPHPR
ncbi:MAG TPA: peptidoglycan-binding domain-containing protein [Terriglobia bacterium]|nr:peptidoglycan-binding domain-containing protein [Terriglobia bacterium]